MGLSSLLSFIEVSASFVNVIPNFICIFYSSNTLVSYSVFFFFNKNIFYNNLYLACIMQKKKRHFFYILNYPSGTIQKKVARWLFSSRSLHQCLHCEIQKCIFVHFHNLKSIKLPTQNSSQRQSLKNGLTLNVLMFFVNIDDKIFMCTEFS